MNPFPTAEQVLLAQLVDYSNRGVVTPDDFTGSLPFVQVNRIGGPTSRLYDYPTLSVSVFEATYADGDAAAKAVLDVLVDCPIVNDVGWLDELRAASGPQEIPYRNTSIRRWIMTVSYSARRQAAP